MAKYRIDDLALDQVTIIEAATSDAAVAEYLECRESNLLVALADENDIANHSPTEVD